MKYSEFEKQMSEKLGSHKVELDTADFYKSLKDKQRRNRKGAIIFYLPLMMLGLLIVGYAYHYLGGDMTENRISQTQSYSLKSESNLAKAHFVKQESLNVQSNSNPLTNSNTSNTNKTEQSYNINKIISGQSKSTIGNSLSSKKVTSGTNDIASKQEIASALNEGEPTKVTSIENLNTANEKSTINFEVNADLNTTDLNNPKNPIHKSNEVELSKRSLLSSINDLDLLEPLSLENEKKFILDTDIKCPDFRINKSRISVELLADAGYFLPVKKYQDISTEVNEVNQLRRVHEDSREGYHAGIYAKFRNTKWPVYIQAGLSQDHVTERMTLEYNYTRMDTTQGIISITTSENGDTITAIIGDIITETEVSGKKIKHYRLRSIDVPVTLGYSLPLNRFTVDVEGGVLFNLGIKDSGSILADQTDFDDVSAQNPFKSNIGISYLGGISLGYHLTPRSKLYINTKFRIIPEEINAPSNSLSQKYLFGGINLGYGYTF